MDSPSFLKVKYSIQTHRRYQVCNKNTSSSGHDDNKTIFQTFLPRSKTMSFGFGTLLNLSTNTCNGIPLGNKLEKRLSILLSHIYIQPNVFTAMMESFKTRLSSLDNECTLWRCIENVNNDNG